MAKGHEKVSRKEDSRSPRRTERPKGAGRKEYREIIFEQKGAIAVLTLNRPDIRNAFTHQEMIDEIVDACQRVQDAESVSVLVVTGAGSAFSAGGNVKDMYKKEGMFSGDPNDVRQNYRKGIQRVTLAFQRLDVPAIAAVNGPAMGAGCDLTCMCDIRIASEKSAVWRNFCVGRIDPRGWWRFLAPAGRRFFQSLGIGFHLSRD